jgi:hypothetical protein
LVECIPENWLELHVLGAMMDPERLKGIRSHLAVCAVCRAASEDLAAYYREAEGVPAEEIDAVAARLAPAPVGGVAERAILLKPLERERPAGRKYLLAADGGRKSRYEAVRSFANEEADMIARMVRDHSTGELTLYLVVEGHGGYSDKIISIDGIDDRFVPDEEGRVRLTGIDEKRIGSAGLHLQSPLASFDFTTFTGLKERIALEGRFEIAGSEFDRIQIEVEEGSAGTRYKIRIGPLRGRPDVRDVHVVVSQKGGPAVDSRAVRGVAVFENLDLEKVLTVRIY